ncbi:hypothetical protein RUM44_007654 [Polyplax serrata]|uniref:Uncharacterized protein n=1 Tax=Polyplax serrata TaxID=468196 RepID=A0ABR1BAK2_POLSC
MATNTWLLERQLSRTHVMDGSPPHRGGYDQWFPVEGLLNRKQWAEVGMIIGLLLYDSHNVENPSACKSRRESGGLDHLFRACAGRLALEHWKRFQGLGNELAYPPNDPRSRRLRQELVGKASWTDSETLPGFLSTFATKQVSWDWAVNLAEPGLDAKNYRLDAPNLWTNGKLIQIGNGEDTPTMDSLLNRVNLIDSSEIPLYRSHPDFQGRSGVVFLLETSQYLPAYSAAGWNITAFPEDMTGYWTWGTKSSRREGGLSSCRFVLDGNSPTSRGSGQTNRGRYGPGAREEGRPGRTLPLGSQFGGAQSGRSDREGTQRSARICSQSRAITKVKKWFGGRKSSWRNVFIPTQVKVEELYSLIANNITWPKPAQFIEEDRWDDRMVWGKVEEWAIQEIVKYRPLSCGKCGACSLGSGALEDGLKILFHSAPDAALPELSSTLTRMRRLTKGLCSDEIAPWKNPENAKPTSFVSLVRIIPRTVNYLGVTIGRGFDIQAHIAGAMTRARGTLQLMAVRLLYTDRGHTN